MSTSVAHHHICAAVNSALPERQAVRILDAGCGDGRLMALLQSKLTELRPAAAIEVHGFDVPDAHVQPGDQPAKALDRLSHAHPGINWQERLRSFAGAWPYPDGFFDVIVSNQVLEHVRDHDGFFFSVARCLAEGGVSIHLFPLAHTWLEAHLNLPFVHWIDDHDLRVSYVRLCSRLGLGKYRGHRHLYDLDGFVTAHADYMTHETNYLAMRDVHRLAKKHGLRSSFRYSGGYYVNKVRQLVGRPLRYIYASPPAWLHRTALTVLCRLASVTAVLEKRNAYADRWTLHPRMR